MTEFNPRDYWEKRLLASLESDGVGYSGLGKNYNDWLYKVRRHVFFRKTTMIFQYFENLRVLDVGCGNGFYIERWKDLGVRKVVGIDITEIAVKTLSRKFPSDEFYQLDIGSNEINQINNRKFDAISAFDVLFHIMDDARYEKAIINIYHLLNPDGLFLWSDNFLHDSPYRVTHQACRTLPFIESLLYKTGFEIVGRWPVFYFMNAPLDISCRLHRYFWKLITVLVSRYENWSRIIGCFLYPIELIFINTVKEGPSTEFMICRKR